MKLFSPEAETVLLSGKTLICRERNMQIFMPAHGTVMRIRLSAGSEERPSCQIQSRPSAMVVFVDDLTAEWELRLPE